MKKAKTDYPERERFEVGEVWKSPRGILYTVTEIVAGAATLKSEKKTIRRFKDDTSRWKKVSLE